MFRFDTPTARLRAVAFLEGLSFVLLLGIAMPLKYFGDMPGAVTLLGRVHGGLFVLLALLVIGRISEGKSVGWGARIGLASVLPFGTFFLDASLRRDDEEYRSRSARAAERSGG